MRDWTKTLHPASFRGVRFWVDFDDLSGGRRLAVHEFGGGERSEVEDLGKKTPGFDITAYLVGDTADRQARNLTAAMSTGGPGYLVLPIDGGFLASPEDFHRSRAKDRMGHIAFDLRFVPSPAGGGTVLTAGDLAAAFANGLSDVVAAFSRMVA